MASAGTGEDPPLPELAALLDQRWVDRSPHVMLETFRWFWREGFGLTVEDLLHLPQESCVLVEGFRLLPHLMKPLLAAAEHPVWLVPTPNRHKPTATLPT